MNRDFQTFGDEGGFVAHRYWQSLKSGDFNDAVRRMAGVEHWEIMLPAMDIGEEIRAAFMESMFLPAEKLSPSIDYETEDGKAMLERAKARRERAWALRECRSKAIGGLLAVRNVREKHVLRTARNLSAAFETGIVPQSSLDRGKGLLTGYLCECVAAGDWKSLEVLSKMLKRGEAPEDARGGEFSYEGQTWNVFCLFHLNHRNLPTKRLIREEMTLEHHNRADFSKWLNALGLGGLPEE